MAKLQPWPARWPVGHRPDTKRKPLKTGETFPAGAFITLDGTDVAEVSGADPTDLYGIAAEDASDVLEDGYVMVYHFNQSTYIAMQGTRAPITGDIDTDYGIIEDADGVYVVDPDETVETRLTVEDVDTVRELYFVKILAAHIQS